MNALENDVCALFLYILSYHCGPLLPPCQPLAYLFFYQISVAPIPQIVIQGGRMSNTNPAPVLGELTTRGAEAETGQVKAGANIPDVPTVNASYVQKKFGIYI